MASVTFVFISAVLALAFADEILDDEQCASAAPATNLGLDQQDQHTMVLLQESSLIQFQSLAKARAETGTEATAAAMADLRVAIKMTSKLRQHFGPQVAKDTWHSALAEVQQAITKAAPPQQADGSMESSTDALGAPIPNGQMMTGASQPMYQAAVQNQDQQQQQQGTVSLASSAVGAAGQREQQAAFATPHQPQALAQASAPGKEGAPPGEAAGRGSAPGGGGQSVQGVSVARIAPFGKEDTATELTRHAERTQDTLVDAVENAEVAEVKRAVFRALTRLRAASIKEFDTIARLETQAIDEYNDAHHYRAENPLAYLHSSEARVTEDKYTSFH